VANHRADKRAVLQRRSVVDLPTTQASRGPATGKRKAVKPAHAGRTPTSGRKTLISGIPSAPSLVGAAAVALAAVGAVTVSSAEGAAPVAAGQVRKLSAEASVLTANRTVPVGALAGRERAVSRDSQRQALRDAADKRLRAVAERKAKERNAALAELAASAEKQAALIARNAWQLPVAPNAYHLTSRFGECSGLWSHCHTGLDFAAPTGTPIHAVAGGTVTEVGPAGAYGNRTIVTLEDGTELWYCHQTSYVVSTGQHVRPGEVIGAVGSTGNVTGPHVHLEVRPRADHPVDPFAALAAHGLHP
jgi:murein DD-endopeptidase MepM/ murein hydrolase activator NlpD